MGFKERTILVGEDPKGKIKNIKLTLGQELITDDFELIDYLKEVVNQLKINNKILNEVHDLNVTELDIK